MKLRYKYAIEACEFLNSKNWSDTNPPYQRYQYITKFLFDDQKYVAKLMWRFIKDNMNVLHDICDDECRGNGYDTIEYMKKTFSNYIEDHIQVSINWDCWCFLCDNFSACWECPLHSCDNDCCDGNYYPFQKICLYCEDTWNISKRDAKKAIDIIIEAIDILYDEEGYVDYDHDHFWYDDDNCIVDTPPKCV